VKTAADIICELWPDNELSAEELALFERNIQWAGPRAIEDGLRCFRMERREGAYKTPRDFGAMKAQIARVHENLRNARSAGTASRFTLEMARAYAADDPYAIEVFNSLPRTAQAEAVRLYDEFLAGVCDRVKALDDGRRRQLRDMILDDPRVSRALKDGQGRMRGLRARPVITPGGEVDPMWRASIVQFWHRSGKLGAIPLPSKSSAAPESSQTAGVA